MQYTVGSEFQSVKLLVSKSLQIGLDFLVVVAVCVHCSSVFSSSCRISFLDMKTVPLLILHSFGSAFSNSLFSCELSFECEVKNLVYCLICSWSSFTFGRTALFFDVTKVQNAGLPMVLRGQQIRSIFADKGNSGARFGPHLLPQAVLIS